ncbi:uncharacterized protein LOC142786478 [Rhipicephalus microplus]|uniref:uncharacterized protein LOC142786478 n=1 Tax=Rhipicephalus microplus TaxID=6941 RepID=UPI003F6BC22F
MPAFSSALPVAVSPFHHVRNDYAAPATASIATTACAGVCRILLPLEHRGNVASCTDNDLHSEEECDSDEECVGDANLNSSLECHLPNGSVARSGSASSTPSDLFGASSEKTALSPDKESLTDNQCDFQPGDDMPIPRLSPVLKITTDPLVADISCLEDDEGQSPFQKYLTEIPETELSPFFLYMPTIPEEPDLEAQMAIEHLTECCHEQLSVLTEEELVPLNLDVLFSEDREVTTDAEKGAEKVVPSSPFESRPVLSQEGLQEARPKVAPLSTEVERARSMSAAVVPSAVTKDFVANESLEMGKSRGAIVLSEDSQDVSTRANDLMSMESALMHPGNYHQAEFGEQFAKKLTFEAPSTSKSPTRSEEVDSADEDSVVDMNPLPIRSRLDLWKKREKRAIRKGMIVNPYVTK